MSETSWRLPREKLKDDVEVNSVQQAGQMTVARQIVVFVSLGLTMLLASLDLTIVTTAVPKIAEDFAALSDATWIATAYMLTTTALQPLYGKLSDTFGRKPTLMGAILVFLGGSAACGWASTMGVLVFGRALQGVGGAGLLSLVFIVVSDLTAEHERAAYMGVLGAVWSIASVVGPLLGGVFSDKASWRWAFWINLVAAIPVLPILMLVLKLPKPQGSFTEKLKKVDFAGSLVLIGGVVMLLLALTWGGKTFPWSSARVICLLVFGVLTLGVFLLIEWKVALVPIVPMRLLANRNVGLIVASQFFMGASMYSVMFFVPIWYTIVKHSSSTAAGLHLLPYLLGMSIVSILSGFVVSRLGMYRPLAISGAALVVLGSGLLILFDEQVNFGKQVGFLLIMGVGLGLDIQVLLVAVQAAAPLEDMAAATSLYLFMRVLGSSIGVSVLQSVFQNAVIPKLDSLAELYPSYASVFSNSLDDQGLIYKADLPQQARDQLVHAFSLALQKVFIATVPFAAVFFVLLLGIKHVPIRKSPS
ncbi:hypothetical protein IWW40_005473 [Coemansia sp. RSA 1250]|nr:hypothetical protein IWW40_005473 [Coemansia sp. RSA 1250]